MIHNKIAIVIVAASPRQHTHIWPSYRNTFVGMDHDLIIMHRGDYRVPEQRFVLGNVHVINKINEKGEEVPHKAFGAYRFAFEEFKEDYDLFVFISDDVIFKRDNWLLDIYNGLNQHEKIGFGASQVFNGNKNYPHESHLRAPFWFAKTECLSKIDWQFNSDHDGEMRIGDQLSSTGYFGIQIGNKINLGYDVDEPDHITQIMENTFFPDHLKKIFCPIEFHYFDNLEHDRELVSPWGHISNQKVLSDLEPFDNLIYYPSLETAKQYCNIEERNGAHILCPQ